MGGAMYSYIVHVVKCVMDFHCIHYVTYLPSSLFVHLTTSFTVFCSVSPDILLSAKVMKREWSDWGLKSTYSSNQSSKHVQGVSLCLCPVLSFNCIVWCDVSQCYVSCIVLCHSVCVVCCVLCCSVSQYLCCILCHSVCVVSLFVMCHSQFVTMFGLCCMLCWCFLSCHGCVASWHVSDCVTPLWL
jgi:hypothetical protein